MDSNQTQHTASKCDLCGGSTFEEISNRDRRDEELFTGVCTGCGLVAHIPVPSEEEVSAYYAEQYRRDYHGESTPSQRRIMRAWKNGERILKQLFPRLNKEMKVFEIGAGIGCTVKAFELQGFDASGIEPNKDFNAFTREQLKASVENRNLYDLPAEPTYDLVLLIHVIEHFSSPTRALTQIHNLIKEDGFFYVECPNLAAPFATYDRLFHYAHIYNFTPATLIALAKKCGFELVSQFTDESHPDIHMLFRKVDEKSLDVSPAEAERSKAAVHRYNNLTYHLRPAYLGRRIVKLFSYLQEFIFARAFVKGLLKFCNKKK
ncbi:Methyltransferase domain-containing protein [Mariprofundus ferrinatatus]|uniref:Methyltransferase domain-containing protein n=1 Tax=Mariprofundus ferrinatatus TaxID=1921087 RepID=A0A2K8LA72_9PROT|nr:class I SAM-dependent methyltransferase [Mariprofundus ferrinatatus]ATX81844.1 Methyltransferase domain-containing protein [Mariprofundus ferrinatatus]